MPHSCVCVCVGVCACVCMSPLPHASGSQGAGAGWGQGWPRRCLASFADWLSIDMPRHVYEGDEVVVRCSGDSSDMIGKVMYYKDGSLLATYHGISSHTISNARPGDSGSYSCEVHELFFYRFRTGKTRAAWLTVQGEASLFEGL